MTHPLNTPLGRFGIATFEEGPDGCVASIPAGGMVNPLTGAPTIAPLAMLVDHIGGLVNHHRRASDEWTVSSELSLELTPDAGSLIAAAPDVPVLGRARPFGRKATSALGLCEFSLDGVVVATGSVRSFYVKVPADLAKFPEGPSGSPPAVSLAERMAVRVAESGGATKVLLQDCDPVLNNSMGIVHGGVSAMALELVGSAVVNAGRGDESLDTASLRVNFLRQFATFPDGPQSRYEGTALRVGRGSGVAEARAIDANGKLAIIARFTAYLR